MQQVISKVDSNQVTLNRYNLEDNHWFYKGIRAILKNNFNRLLKNTKTSNKQIKILDIGCGSGANLFLLKDYGDVYGIDISELAIDCAKKRGLTNLTVGSAENLPYKDNDFDFVISIQVFCNIPENDSNAWKEAYRVLKPGGYFVSLLPAYKFLFSNHDVASGSYRRYDVKDLRISSEKAGFESCKITFYNFLFFPLVAGLRLTSKMLSRGNLVPRTDLKKIPTFINYFMAGVVCFEAFLSNLISYPYGLSIFSIHRKSIKL